MHRECDHDYQDREYTMPDTPWNRQLSPTLKAVVPVCTRCGNVYTGHLTDDLSQPR